MRFMVMVVGPDDSGPPDSQMLADMGRYNEQLIKAGVMKAGEGLLPTKAGAQLTFSKGKPTVTDGPFPEAKEVIGGFWIFETVSLAETLEWARKIPFVEGKVEIRQVAETEDYVADDISRETLEKEKEWQKTLRT